MEIEVSPRTHIENDRAEDLRRSLQDRDVGERQLATLLREGLGVGFEVVSVVLQKYATTDEVDLSTPWLLTLKHAHAVDDDRWYDIARSNLPDPKTMTPYLLAHCIIQDEGKWLRSVMDEAELDLAQPEDRPVHYRLYSAAYYGLRFCDEELWDTDRLIDELQNLHNNQYNIETWLEQARTIDEPTRQFALDTIGVANDDQAVRTCLEAVPDNETNSPEEFNDIFEQAARRGDGQTLAVMADQIDDDHDFDDVFVEEFFTIDAGMDEAPSSLPPTEVVRTFLSFRNFAIGGLTPEQVKPFYQQGDAEALALALDNADRTPRPEQLPETMGFEKLQVILNHDLGLSPDLKRCELAEMAVSEHEQDAPQAVQELIDTLAEEHLEKLIISEGRFGPGVFCEHAADWLETDLSDVLPSTAAACADGLVVADLMLIEALEAVYMSTDVLGVVYDRAKRSIQDLPDGVADDAFEHTPSAQDALRLYEIVDEPDSQVLREHFDGKPIEQSTTSTIGGNYDRAYKLLQAGAAVPDDEEFYKVVLNNDSERAEEYLERGNPPASVFYWALKQDRDIFEVVARHYKPTRPTAIRAANRMIANPSYDIEQLDRLNDLSELNDFGMDWNFEPSRGSDELSLSPLALVAGYDARPKEQKSRPRRSMGRRRLELVERLTELGADPAAVPEAMREALTNGYINDVEKLIEQGFDPGEYPRAGTALLQSGIEQGDRKLRRLIENGLRPEQASDAYLRALQPAPDKDWTLVAEALNEVFSPDDQYDLPSASIARVAIEALNQRGVNFNRPEGCRALRQWIVVADEGGPGDVVEELLDKQQKRGEFRPPPMDLVEWVDNGKLRRVIEEHMTKRQTRQLNIQSD